MIQCICGPTGSGKTLYAIWLMNELAKRGQRVATNIELTSKHPSYKNIFKIGTDKYPVYDDGQAFFSHFPKDALGHSYMNYFIDEADVFLDCTEWANTAKQVRMYFKQHRKLKDNVFLIVQDPNTLYNRIRMLVHEYVWCTMDGDTNWTAHALLKHVVPKSMWRYRRTAFSSIKMTAQDVLRTGHFTFSEGQEFWNWYKTEQLIGSCDF